MTSRELLYVKTIAEQGSLTRAAQKLFITQPSLSHCVARLEQELGAPLFRRTTQGLVPTLAGERYYETACRILRLYDDLQAELDEINGMQKGRVTFGVTNYLATALLPEVLPAFHRAFSRIEVAVEEENSTEMERSLITGKLDFVVMHTSPGAAITKRDGLRFYPLHRDAFLLGAPPQNPYRAHALPCGDGDCPRLDLQLVADEPFLLVSRDQRIRQVSEHILQRAGIAPPVLFTSKSYETLRRLCAQGMGYTLLPRQYAGLFAAAQEVQPCYYAIDPACEPYWTLTVAAGAGSYLSNASRALITALCERFADDGWQQTLPAWLQGQQQE